MHGMIDGYTTSCLYLKALPPRFPAAYMISALKCSNGSNMDLVCSSQASSDIFAGLMTLGWNTPNPCRCHWSISLRFNFNQQSILAAILLTMLRQ